jgi:predicted esterase
MPEEPDRLILLLHGFQQEGAVIANLLGDALPKQAAVIAPDGHFPIPVRTREGYRMGFTWYFFDPVTQQYFKDMSAALGYLDKLWGALELPDLPLTIIGYSQGAYLAPHAGLRLPRVNHVIGINGRFRSEVLTEALPFRIDAINGMKDPSVDPERARGCFQDLKDRGCRGAFHAIENGGHGIGRNIRALVEKLLAIREP